MPGPNDRRPKDEPQGRKGEPAAPQTAAKKTPAPKAPPPEPQPVSKSGAAPGPDSLKTVMPTGELGSRNSPGIELASDSGGTSKAEDTSRAAGYVADLTKTNEPPPGPPVQKSPENYSGLQKTTNAPSPEKKKDVASAPSKPKSPSDRPK